jgi:hypothetical protein
MSVSTLNNIAYIAHVNLCGLYGWEIIKGKKYYYMETDGTLTDLGECVHKESDSKICWHDGPSWSEKINFENTKETRYTISHGGSSGCGGRLPITEQKE